MTMRPIQHTIAIEEARAIIAATIQPLTRTERVPLLEASGRVLATDVQSTSDVPPFSRAGMDGYAVLAEDTFGASRYDARILRQVATIYTGEVSTQTLTSGLCAEIATGAPMPAGADAVVMVEETEKGEGTEIRVLAPVYPRQNVGRQGADIAVGQTVLRTGMLLNPSRIGALAALGRIDVEVFEKPTVAILSTGNEIAEPGAPLASGQIYDINRFTLSTIVAEHGAQPVARSTAHDTIEALEAAVDACLACDVVVFSGGSSVGERDLILDVIRRKGEVLFHGVSVKPGKPTAFGLVAGKPVFGMPGYPTSCLSNAYMLLAPALRQMAHLPPAVTRTVTLPLAKRIVSTTGRHQFYTVRIEEGQATPAFKASGDITSMAHADGFIEIPIQTDIVEQGEMVMVTLF